MKRTIGRRLVHLAVILLGVSFMTFLLMYISPGDPAQKKLTAALPEDLRESARRMQSKFHLDAPAWLAEGDQPVYLQAIADAPTGLT